MRISPDRPTWFLATLRRYFFGTRFKRAPEGSRGTSLERVSDALQRGDTLSKGTLKDGNGTRLMYFPTGELQLKSLYKFGLPDSNWTYYYKDGRVSAEGKMGSTGEQGLWQYYYDNGGLQSKGNFKDGEKTGEWSYYAKNGSLIETVSEGQEQTAGLR